MAKELSFNVKCSQKLDDGDTALVEEYRNVDKYEVTDIMTTYYQRSSSKSYVNSFTITVEINH
jgi:hypothetical protein